LLYGIPLSISYTGLGLAAGGWITIAVGALAGGLLGFALRRPRQRTSGVALTA
jgi:outer membrane lipoprotein SlyB